MAHAHTHTHDHGHDDLIELLDLDVVVLHAFHAELIALAGSLTPDRPRIIDVGAGSGAGAIALAGHLPDAEVIAIDLSQEFLEHLHRKAQAAGVADRIRIVQADLDQPWPDLGPADLVWASASLHHLADPDHAAAQVFAALRPGGVLLATELDSFPSFLSEDPVGAALEERGHAAQAQVRAEEGMHMGEDWGARLGKAGFIAEAPRRMDIVLRPPLPAAAGRYAQVCLRRMRSRLEGRLDAGELAALDALVAGIVDRDDLVVRATRTVWLARRPPE